VEREGRKEKNGRIGGVEEKAGEGRAPKPNLSKIPQMPRGATELMLIIARSKVPANKCSSLNFMYLSESVRTFFCETKREVYYNSEKTARTTDCAFVTSEAETVSIAHVQRERTGTAYIYKQSDSDAKQMGT